MEIRFKFRSSPTFDTVDIGQQSSISIRDLKSKIVLKKHLNLSHDFDLVFSDSFSGTEYTDENTQIPSGSSVIIKRVPANSSPSLRHSEKVPTRDEKLEAIPPTQSNPKDCSANEESTLVMQSKPMTKEQTKFDRTVAEKNIELESCDMPSELKCSVCTTYFKEAVMIPCCQHSFCDKCIRLKLVENLRCPMCFSTKCKPEDLLPNLSLRQTINRFLESQPHHSLENNLDRYAPDGESGIQVRDLSYAAIVPPRDLQLNRSATKVSAKLLGDTKYNHVALENCTEFEGENEPLNVAGTNDEANSYIKNVQSFHGVTEGGGRNFITPCRRNKGLRTCYMCGSPDHLIRDCPAAASSHTGTWNGNVSFQGVVPGYAPQYWPGNPPHCRPLYNMFHGPETILYNTNMAAVTPFALSPYASSMFSGYPITSGCLAPGGMAPPYGINAHQMGQSDVPGLMGCAKQRRIGSEGFEREKVLDRDHNANKQHANADRDPSYSGDSFARRSQGDHRSHERSNDDDKYSNGKRLERISRSSEANFRNAQLDRSTSEKAMHDSRIRPPVGKHENSHRCSRRNEEMIAHHVSDSGQDHHYSTKYSSKRRRMEHERSSDREFHSHSESGLEPSYSSGDERRKRKVSGHRSLHSYETSKRNGKDVYHERGRMIRFSDDYGEDYHSRKRKRYH